MPELTNGPANPYPSSITVSGLTSAVFKVTVTIININHTWPDDLDIILVGPGGQRTYLVSDAGLDVRASNVTITLDDDAAQPVPDNGPMVSGTFRPGNFGANDPFAPPAPPPPYATNLAVFKQTNPNGVWSLYVMDDLPEDTGYIEGWRLNLTLQDPIADLAVSTVATPVTGLAGSNTTFVVTVTNQGPAAATGVLLTNTLPANAAFVSATTTQGSCTPDGSLVRCDLGSLARNAAATVRVTVNPFLGGSITHTAQVAAAQLDLVSTNNQSVRTITVLPASDLRVQAVDHPATLLHGDTLVYTLAVTNTGPDTAAGVRVTNRLDAALLFVSATPTQGGCASQNGLVTCDLGSLPAGNGASIRLTAQTTAPGSVTNQVQVANNNTDPNPADNQLSLTSSVAPSADLGLLPTALPQILPIHQPHELVYVVTNLGPSTAIGAQMTNQHLSGATLVSASTDRGACVLTNGSFQCQFDPIPPGSAATVNVRFIPDRTGFLTNAVLVLSPAADLNPGNNSLGQSAIVAHVPDPFTHTNRLVFPLSGPAAPYPATLEVAGLTAAVFKVTVTLSNLSHTFPDDLNFLLVGPAGQTALLMSDAGGANAISNVTLTFDQSAPVTLPNSALISSGRYRPTAFGGTTGKLPAPAPPGPFASDLGVFNGTNPNGTWSLYAADDRPLDDGVLADGWSLVITTVQPIADLAVAGRFDPNPVANGNPVTGTFAVTNRGPADATSTRLTARLPAGLDLVSAVPSQGGCGPGGLPGEWVCNLGTLPAGGTATLTLSAQATGLGRFTNQVEIAAMETDVNPTNNSLVLVLESLTPPNIHQQPRSRLVQPGGTVEFQVGANGSSLVYQWLYNGVAIPNAEQSTHTISNAQPAQAGLYSVQVGNPLAILLSDPAELLVVSLPEVVTLPALRVASTGVVAQASIVPNGGATIAWFEWGFTSSYGRVTEPLVLGNGTNAVPLTAVLAAFPPDTLHHFRAVAANQLGLVAGEDQTFLWSSAPPVITSIVAGTNSSLRIEFSGQPGQFHLIQSTTNLSTWDNRGPATESSSAPGRFHFLDTTVPSDRLYRVHSP